MKYINQKPSLSGHKRCQRRVKQSIITLGYQQEIKRYSRKASTLKKHKKETKTNYELPNIKGD